MTKTDIEKFVNPNTGRLSIRIKSYTDLSIEELYCIYNEVKKDKNLKFISFTKGYSKNFKSNYILDSKEDLIKYKDLIITKSGRLETNKLCQVKFSAKEIYDTIYKKGICKNCNKNKNIIEKKVKTMTVNGKYNNNSIKAKETEISKYGCVFQKTEKFINSRKNTCLEKYNKNYSKEEKRNND